MFSSDQQFSVCSQEQLCFETITQDSLEKPSKRFCSGFVIRLIYYHRLEDLIFPLLSPVFQRNFYAQKGMKITIEIAAIYKPPTRLIFCSFSDFFMLSFNLKEQLNEGFDKRSGVIIMRI